MRTILRAGAAIFLALAFYSILAGLEPNTRGIPLEGEARAFAGFMMSSPATRFSSVVALAVALLIIGFTARPRQPL
jgi:hypothetical protein